MLGEARGLPAAPWRLAAGPGLRTAEARARGGWKGLPRLTFLSEPRG